MVQGHRIKQKIEVSKFLEQIQEYKEEDIETTYHTFFRLNEKQRKIFDEVWIKDIILNQEPFLVGIQYNNLWSLFYKYQKNKCHHTLKGVVCDRHLFLGCSEIENSIVCYDYILKDVVFNF